MDIIKNTWSLCVKKLFCEKTNLFYDYCVGDAEDCAVWHLPSPEAIKLQVPNPNGWGTGMEDSVLTAGSVIDALISMYKTGEDSDKIKAFADKVLDGMMLCAGVSESAGFLARSVSPFDGKSYYYNSSRDQYTHFIYGAVRFYNTDLCSEKQKEDIRRVLVLFAEKAERDVIPENDYMLLRADGKKGIVTGMWGENLGGHEYFRLPMFYLAAWYVSGDEKWYEKYMKYRDTAFEKSICPDVWKKRAYPILQMQYSLRLAYDIERDEAFKCRIAEKLHEIAVRYADFARVNVPVLIKNKDTLNFKYNPWDKVPARLVGIYGDLPYYNPGQSELPGNSLYDIRNIGEALTVLALDPTEKVCEEELTAVCSLLSEMNLDGHNSYAPLLVVCGYYAALENIKSFSEK